jgi:phage terminase large subunit
MKATIVFSKNWKAIHLKCYYVKHTVDNCFDFYSLDTDGSLVFQFNKKVDITKYRVDELLSITFLVDVNKLQEFGCDLLYQRYRYIVNRGSSRSSKTTSIIDVYDLYARENANKRLTVWRDTKTDCVKTVLADVEKHLRLTGRYLNGNKFNSTKSIFTYYNNSTFEIHGTDDDVTVHGLNQDAAWLNEPYKISKSVFDQIDQRTADFIIIDYNPKMGHWVEDIIKDERCIVIDSTFRDNPFCPDEQRRKILSYQPLKMCSIVESKLLSISDAEKYDVEKNINELSEKQLNELIRCIENERKNSASEFNWMVYGLGLKSEQPNRIFNWYEIPDSEYFKLDVPVYYGVDWGAVDPWGIIEAKYYDGALYIHELNYSSENEIKSKLSATEWAQIESVEEGIVKWMFRKLSIPTGNYIVCDNNRPLKILALRDAGWDYSISAIKPPGSIIDGISSLNNIKVYFTSSSKNVKYEQENYSRKIDKFDRVLEEPEDRDNHTIDPVRYIYQFLADQEIIKKI